MKFDVWWKAHPAWLAEEEESFRTAGITFRPDERAFAQGIARYELDYLHGDQTLRLIVAYPDLFPYFRMEVAAPELSLGHHQHPFSKFLCLQGRQTHNWDTTDTAVAVLRNRLNDALRTGETEDPAQAVGEQQQAEPFSDYYHCEPRSIVVVQSSWKLGEAQRSGSFILATQGQAKAPPGNLIRGAIVEVRNDQNAVLYRADESIRKVFAGAEVAGRWVRVPKEIAVETADAFVDYLLRTYPAMRASPVVAADKGFVQLWGVAFPEEDRHRSKSGQGWVFPVRIASGSQELRDAAQLKTRRKGSRAAYFAFAGRAGIEDVQERTPELAPLRHTTVSVFGLGCLGAPIALELARCGVGELRLLDPDIVDPATIGRWPFGLAYTGLQKVAVIRDIIERHYPWTRVIAEFNKLGAVRSGHPDEQSDPVVVEKLTAGTSLVFDTTAELGVHTYLADVAAHLGVPYLSVAGTFGGWGGTIIRIVPGQTEGCWYCAQSAFKYGPFTYPPSDPKGEVQPRGCGDPTFTGASFDLVQVALTGIRLAVSTLCAGVEHGYPSTDWDVMTIAFRNDEGMLIQPQFRELRLEQHPKCPKCNPAAA